jgi:hypothetical protein
MPSLPISYNTSGNQTVLAAPAANKFIRVLGYVLNAAGAVNVRWSGSPTAGNTTGAMDLAAAGSTISSDLGFDLSPGDSLVLNLSAAVQVSGHVSYTIVG